MDKEKPISVFYEKFFEKYANQKCVLTFSPNIRNKTDYRLRCYELCKTENRNRIGQKTEWVSRVWHIDRHIIKKAR